MTNRIADGTGVLLQYPGVGVLHIVGVAADMPGDGEVGYAHGCIFQVTDTSGSDTGLYTNVGNRTSCNFDSIEVAGGSTDATTLAGVTPTAAGLALLDDANAAAQRTTLGLGTFAVENIAAVPALTMAGNVALGGNYLSNAGGNSGVQIAVDGTASIVKADFNGVDPKLTLTNLYNASGAGSAIEWYHYNGTSTYKTARIIGRRASLGANFGEFAIQIGGNNSWSGDFFSLNVNGLCTVPALLATIEMYTGSSNALGLYHSNGGAYAGSITNGFWTNANTYMRARVGSNDQMGFIWNGGLLARNNGWFGWRSDTDVAQSDGDTHLIRDGAAGALALENGTSGTSFSAYYTTNNTHGTSGTPTNYERLRFYFNSGVPTIASENGGTGTARNIAITPAGGLIGISGTGASFPALKRSSTQLQVRLADDSGYAPFACGLITAAGGIAFAEATDITTGATTGTKIGTGTSNKIGFWNATPVVQPVHIADPAGGATVDAEARTAIAAINAMLAATGLTAAA